MLASTYDIVHRCLIPYFQHWLNAGLRILLDVDGLIWEGERGYAWYGIKCFEFRDQWKYEIQIRELWMFTSEISVKREHGIFITVIRYFYFLMSKNGA